jgi:hypothetical protein
MFCALELIFGSTEGTESNFHVLRCQTYFPRFCGSRVHFSCFVLSDSLSAVPRASGPLFMFYDPELIFGNTMDTETTFHVLRSRTRFQRYRGHRVHFSFLALLDSFLAVPRELSLVFLFYAPIIWRYLGHWVHFSCFVLPNSFSAVPRASSPVFMF